MENARLIYKSIASDEEVSNEMLRDLIEKSSANNGEDGITGLLLVSGREFLQVLEGPADRVNALFQKICHDLRHHTINLIEYQQTTAGYFEDWTMRLVDLYDLPGEKRKLLMEKYENSDGNILIPDKLHLVFSLLLDARKLCLGEPWVAD